MKRLISFLLPLALGASFAVQASHEIPFSPEQIAALGIAMASPEPAGDAGTAVFAARVVVPPGREEIVSAPLAGLLETLLVSEGQAVKAGEELARLRSPALLDLQRAYLQALADHRLALDQFKRDEALFKDGIIAERRLNESRNAYITARTTLASERETLRLSGFTDADLKQLERSGQITASLPIRAPRDGVVLGVSALTGERLEPAAPILRIAAIDQLALELRLPIEDLASVAVDTPVETADGAAQGKVQLIGSQVNPHDGTVLVRVQIEQGTASLRPGQFVQARILGVRGNDSFRVPAVAVVRRGDTDFVFIYRSAGFEPTPVERLAEQGDDIIIRGPLSADDQIAVSGVATIKAAWMGIGGGE